MLGSGFRIGRLYGINIRADWSWLLIVFLITWNLTTVIGQLHPQWNLGFRWGLSLVAALLFFASVLTHEMAHSLVARSQGIPVRNITLFLFGGVANIQREPSTPKNEFLMAVSGPLASLLLGTSLLLVAAGGAITEGVPRPGAIITGLSPVGTILLWLGSINIILAVFNMIPGFPLDGGRVLRSILWAVTNNLRRATRWAAVIGQSIAWIMIAAGIAMAVGLRLPLLGSGLVSGVWLAFIGWFLNNASVQSYRHVAVQDMLEGVRVSQLMYQNPPIVTQDCTISDLIQTKLLDTDEKSFPVLDNGKLLGIINLDDARRVPRDQWEFTTVSQVMTPQQRLVTVTPDEGAVSAMEKMAQDDVHQLPVVLPQPYGRLEFIGLLRPRDILRWLQAQSDLLGERQKRI